MVIALAACSSARTEGGESRDPDRITQADIKAQATSFGTAFDIIRRLEPHWLRKRGATATRPGQREQEMTGDIVIYLDDVRLGGPETLHSVRAETIYDIEFLDAARAVRLGTGHQHGAILIRTR